MDWSKTKSIFIVVFFILNLFLLTLMINKLNANNLTNLPNDTVEDLLSAESITYTKQENEVIEAYLLSAQSKQFTQEEVRLLKGQTVEIKNGSILTSELEEPIPLNEKIRSMTFLTYWSGGSFTMRSMTMPLITLKAWSPFIKRIKTCLSTGTKSIYAQLLFYFNEDRELYAYEQTLLEDIEEFNDKKELLGYGQAVSTVVNQRLLQPNSDVKIDLGYHTSVQLESNFHVLTPTYRLIVEHNGQEKDMVYYVNAYEGKILDISTNDEVLE
ncbi:hypothetical protein Q73_00220 [Bacillus coahuilensis m2-6]|uniref:two-component system regulatory protein YycI n=1 Tax=Bacillus coahuilensis TaxID=408580 RepID=UPI000750111A|nr:two-component system regulatory protein YycI [Bacillus coahuilensis]KUP09999.1 hypothetical protein Q73_00220 [Bacillus coahuilensis m2-6]